MCKHVSTTRKEYDHFTVGIVTKFMGHLGRGTGFGNYICTHVNSRYLGGI
jgi:hypothetical protein